LDFKVEGLGFRASLLQKNAGDEIGCARTLAHFDLVPGFRLRVEEKAKPPHMCECEGERREVRESA